ncbi:Hydrogen peroxide-inducible genes activator [Rhodobacteraceae bacterium THAF1]|uniref:hydrogen peroxide-inducible genes activator n=1 Tax=Palleronia sp. THAF1 TaxID=2587842 RepID=UPI000F3FE316|nr:hydrogen peroxide-inducible genes activator [Palleronia sp. THAF1]QFU08736.1 Hydrogen peroxide-inducible genes activator [Palleronia sp. THAF1]VDC30526.1 Hydrogen peroxide-inducible genes activator [Rhodobacteraceae bacterium THAF1]
MAADVTLKQLTYFVALADTRHYRRAAERVGISQPSLSQQIVGLEEVLGFKLVERGQRGAVLTPNGRKVLEQARRILDEAQTLRTLAQDAREGFSGTIRLGSTPTLGPYLMPHVMRQLHAAYPSLKVIVRDATPVVLQEELLTGQHDLILTQLPVASGDTEVMRLFREPLKLAMARDHPLAAQKTIADADLAGLDVLGLSDAYRLHTQVAALCEELDANLRRDYEGTSLDAVRQMTALDMGISFLPALYARSEVSSTAGDVIIHPFRKDRVKRSIGLAWRRRSAHRDLIRRMSALINVVVRDRFAGVVVIE